MAPEHDARTRAFYDHESDDPSPRRRRAAADWGVNEDIFDRMPSRRFKRPDRRAEHHDEPDARRFERRVSGPSRPADDVWTDEAPRGEDAWGEQSLPLRRDDWTDEHERRQIAPRRGDWPERDEPPRETGEFAAQRREEARRETGEFAAQRREDARREPRGTTDDFAAPRREARGTTDDFPAQRRRRPAESWTVTDDHVPVEDGKRSIDSWLAPDAGHELTLAPGESRTVVLETSPEPEPELDEPAARRTVTITGHPDRLPAPRAKRPPRTAVERIGASPDRIVGYAVLLGFVLVLIAVLTTGQ
jgi:hypothetical protein